MRIYMNSKHKPLAKSLLTFLSEYAKSKLCTHRNTSRGTEKDPCDMVFLNPVLTYDYIIMNYQLTELCDP